MLSEISKIKFFLFYLIHFFCLIYYTSLNLQAPFWIRVERVGTFMSFELMVNIQRFLSFSLMLGLRFLYTFLIIMFIYPFASYVRVFVIIEYWVLWGFFALLRWLCDFCAYVNIGPVLHFWFLYVEPTMYYWKKNNLFNAFSLYLWIYYTWYISLGNFIIFFVFLGNLNLICCCYCCILIWFCCWSNDSF